MKIGYYVLAGQIGDLSLYKAEALAHFLNRNLPSYHFEIVKVPPSQWHSFVEYLVMKLWHPKRFLYYHRLSTKVQKAISKIVEVNDLMTTDIKYKPWELLENCQSTSLKSESLIKENSKKSISSRPSKSKSLIKENSKKSISSSSSRTPSKSKSLIKENSKKSINSNSIPSLNENNEENALSKSPSKDDDKNKIINISLDTVKQTIVISTEDILQSSDTNLSNEKPKPEDNNNDIINNNENIMKTNNSSVSLFSDDQTESLDSLANEDDDTTTSNNNNNGDDNGNNNSNNDEGDNDNNSRIISTGNNGSNISFSKSNSNSSSFSDLNLDDNDNDNNINTMNINQATNEIQRDSSNNNNNNNNNNFAEGDSAPSSNNENKSDKIPNESYYILPYEVDVHIQSILEELPQFTWKVDGEFIGNCDSFFKYIENNYGYQIQMDEDLIEEIADEDVNTQKYNVSDIPIIFSTSNDQYFKNIPRLSEISNSLSNDYIKKHKTHIAIKKFRHHLKNTIDDIKYEDYINKTYNNKDYSSGSLNYSDLEIDSEDLDEHENGNNENGYNNYDDDTKEDYIRSPVRRYHKYVNDGNGNSASNYSNDSLLTPMNSKYTPSTKPQSKNENTENVQYNDDTIESPEEHVMDENEINKEENMDNNNNDEEIEYSYKADLSSDVDDSNDNKEIHLNEQFSDDDDEIIEQIDDTETANMVNMVDEVDKGDIEEDIIKESNEIINQVSNSKENEISKVVSSSNSSNNIVRKTISGSKGSLQRLN
ncbi:hypothetical protein BCR36DRAFT_87585 [Piromyces finnis]|uniref:Uncharacterized protein n=1 Tax=Piromyces finnis TaxID=1754191 RepID=A0A1Y1VKT9_9FUNG|nr:hypothetical protein BCR36DRAFT_87585 [Piromyces finnis]|eukprot:ORX59078.1 hypothetical protein BCR36DRAFT_87585 [Piromyces finnis]